MITGYMGVWHEKPTATYTLFYALKIIEKIEVRKIN